MITQLSEHVWIFPHQRDETILRPNIGIIVDGDETILVDAGSGAPQAQAIKEAIATAGFAPVSQIIYTHGHWDHVFGAYMFDAPIIANQRTVSVLKQLQRPWSEAYLRVLWGEKPARRQQIAHMYGSVGDWEALKIVQPDLVFDNYHTIALNTITIECQHVGGIHSYDSITVWVKEEGIKFVGDSYYPPPVYEQEPGEEELLDLELMDAFMDPQIEFYIDGHNKPFSGKQMQFMVRFQKMRQQANAQAAPVS